MASKTTIRPTHRHNNRLSLAVLLFKKSSYFVVIQNNLFGKRLYIHKAKTNTVREAFTVITSSMKNFKQNKMHPFVN